MVLYLSQCYAHLGYENNSKINKETDNHRNGYITKNVAKLSCGILAGTLAMTLTGCSNEQEALLNGTILNNCTVITMDDGSKDIANVKCVHGLDDSDRTKCTHYHSVISGAKYFDQTKYNDYLTSGTLYQNYSIKNSENIVKYLTKEELEAAINNKLTNDDLLNIIMRINEQEETLTTEPKLVK